MNPKKRAGGRKNDLQPPYLWKQLREAIHPHPLTLEEMPGERAWCRLGSWTRETAEEGELAGERERVCVCE
jgi:hypothetical protein